MKKLHINDLKGGHIHFVGIGGISMSGLAEVLLQKGYTVSGSDIKDSHITRKLRRKGARIFIGHRAANITGSDLVVYTAAVKKDNPELVEAQKKNIPIMDRATLLGQIMENFAYAIGVSGSHGKTTTTSMLAMIMEYAHLDPTVLLGGELDAIGGNVKTGKSGYFITEACEYVESFLRLHPYVAVILNIDRDHLDYFKDINHIYTAFLKFAKLVPTGGYVVGCADDPLVDKLMDEVDCHIIRYGIKCEADWMAHDIKYDSRSCASFRAVYRGQDMGRFYLSVPGKHNVYNALAASATAWALGVSLDTIREGLFSYHGTHRRFEIKGKVDGITVIDDYAHHPTEIRATLATVLEYPHRKVWCVFQPHTYTRTRILFNEFVDALKGIDTLILADIYAAREKNTGEVHSKDLATAVAAKGQPSIYLQTFEEIIDYLIENARPGDIILTMGAGDVYKIGEGFLRRKILKPRTVESAPA